VKGEETVGLLAKAPIFRVLGPAGLARVAARMHERELRRGDVVVHEGDAGDALFVVARGSLKVYVTSPDGDEMMLVTLRPPDTFGELALLDGGPRSATAEALEPSTVLALSRSTFLELARENPTLYEEALRSLGGLVRRLTDQAADLVFLDLSSRVAKLLVGLVERRGEQQGGETVLDLHLTQTELASMVGGSRQSVNQILRSLEECGCLGVEGRRLTVRRPDMLRRVAQGLAPARG